MTTPSPGWDAAPLKSAHSSDPEMAELIQFFVRELPGRAKAIEAALEESRAADLRRLAHQLKGAGGGYGYPQISSAAARVEDAVRAAGDRSLAEIEALRGDVAALLSVCERAIAGVR